MNDLELKEDLVRLPVDPVMVIQIVVRQNDLPASPVVLDPHSDPQNFFMNSDTRDVPQSALGVHMVDTRSWPTHSDRPETGKSNHNFDELLIS